MVPTPVLEAFGAREATLERLPGGRGTTWCAGPFVFKPTNNEIEATWTAALHAARPAQGFRVPRPLKSRQGTYVTHGWTAWTYIGGGTSVKTLKQVLVTKTTFAGSANVVKDIPFEVVTARPHGLPHSLYEKLWHIDYWLRFSLAMIQGEGPIIPAHSSEAFPSDNATLDEASWRQLLDRVRKGLNILAGPVRDEKVLARTSRPGRTVEGELTVVAAHNAYHFGRMVMLRQLLGVWPSELGDSW